MLYDLYYSHITHSNSFFQKPSDSLRAGDKSPQRRNLRIREDTAKYLTNLSTLEAYYDPKSRSMRDVVVTDLMDTSDANRPLAATPPHSTALSPANTALPPASTALPPPVTITTTAITTTLPLLAPLELTADERKVLVRARESARRQYVQERQLHKFDELQRQLTDEKELFQHIVKVRFLFSPQLTFCLTC